MTSLVPDPIARCHKPITVGQFIETLQAQVRTSGSETLVAMPGYESGYDLSDGFVWRSLYRLKAGELAWYDGQYGDEDDRKLGPDNYEAKPINAIVITKAPRT